MVMAYSVPMFRHPANRFWKSHRTQQPASGPVSETSSVAGAHSSDFTSSLRAAPMIPHHHKEMP